MLLLQRGSRLRGAMGERPPQRDSATRERITADSKLLIPPISKAAPDRRERREAGRITLNAGFDGPLARLAHGTA
jgi:hypothetical protein